MSGYFAFQPEKAAIQAGRIMLTCIKTLAAEKANFAFETILASPTFATWNEALLKHKQLGKPICVLEADRVVWIQPENITIKQ